MRLAQLATLDDDRKRRHAAIFAAVYAGGGLVLGLVAAFTGTFGIEQGVAVTLSAGVLLLALGSWKGSRLCAAALLGLFLCDRLLTILGTGSVAPVLWAVVGGFFLWGGLQAAVARQARSARPVAARA